MQAYTSSSSADVHPQIQPSTSSDGHQLGLTLTPRKLKMQRKIIKLKHSSRQLNKKIRAVRQSRVRLLKKTANLKNIIVELRSKLLLGSEQTDILETIDTDGNADFLKRYLGRDKTKKYSASLRKFALCLHFLSPKAYTFVRNEFNTCLPHPKTLSKWYSCLNCEPGFTSEAFEALKKIVKKSTNKIICALSLDEMSIRQHLQWNGRRTVGYVDIGDNCDGDNLPLAKDALVFMVTCINGHWKLPVGYFLTNGVNGEQRSALLKNCIRLLHETGVEVASVTFDGCPSNFAMAKLLGARFDDLTNIDPIIKIDNQNMVIFPDPCHMIKLVRNTLGDKKRLLDGSNKTISWHYIEKLHEIQDNEGLHLANKLKKAHINYKKQVMKVRLATQIFSRSVADSLSFCKTELNLKEFDDSEATQQFINGFNDLFDILNSRRLTAPGLKKPISKKNWAEINNILDMCHSYIIMLRFPDGQSVLNSNRKTGFLGLLICINSLKVLYAKYIDSDNAILDYLCTYKMSQDHIELFFSAVRSKGGFNNNPTAAQFQAAYKRLLIHGELKNIETGNCSVLDDLNILTCNKPVTKINETRNRLLYIDHMEDTDMEGTSIVEVPEGHDYIGQSELTQFSREIVTYIAGFVVTKLTKLIKCDDCQLVLLSEDKFTGLIAHKDRGGLHYPSRDVISLCEWSEKILRTSVKIKGTSFLASKKAVAHVVKAVLKKNLGSKIFQSLNDHTKDQNPMDNHLVLLIKAVVLKYLDVRIYHLLKSISQKDDRVRNFHTKLILFKGQ